MLQLPEYVRSVVGKYRMPYIRRYGLAGYEKIAEEVTQIILVRSRAGISVTSEAIAQFLKVPQILVHHIFVNPVGEMTRRGGA